MRYNDNPLVSVIIPIYNVEKYISECIDSVINQTYNNLEIILVDDGSTDNSLNICDEYARLDHRIRVFHQDNKGLVGARKTGISVATGDIATYVDSDDWIDLNMYEVMVRFMLDSESDIVTSGLIREYEGYSITEMEAISPGIYKGKELKKIIKSNLIDVNKFFRSNISIHIYNKLYERKLLLKNQLLISDYISVGEDAACVYPCLLDASKVMVVNKCFYHYRIRYNSIMDKSSIKDIMGIRKLYQYLYSRFDDYSSIFNLKKQLDLLTIYFILLSSPQQLMDKNKGYLCLYPKVRKGMRVIVYGAGRAAKALMRLLKDSNDYILVAWIDKNDLRNDFCKNNYDYIVIGAYLYSAYQDIYKDLIDQGVPKAKIANLDLRDISLIDWVSKEDAWEGEGNQQISSYPETITAVEKALFQE